MFLQELLTFFLGGFIIIEYMEGIGIFIFWIDTISRKAAAQTVGTVMHDGHRVDNRLAADPVAVFGKHSADSATGRNADIAFSEGICCHKISSLFSDFRRPDHFIRRSQLFRFSSRCFK